MRAIIVLARAPSAPGKTRLTAGLDPDAAVALRRALLLDTLDVALSLGERVIVSFTPAAARLEIDALIAESAIKGTVPFSAISAIAQRENCDLGERMYAALEDAQGLGASQVILLGSDLANLPAAYLQDAFAQLQGDTDVVLGPAEDGGYYLVGLNAAVLPAAKPLFEHIEWGSHTVLTQTLQAAARARLRTALIATWFDIDTRDDLARIRSDARTDAARCTKDWLARFSLA